ncbi:glycosyltransferase family A protein [Dellaglioa algida]|uniref:Glycosyltransferase 2-like domain-containing protein n=1 Tax=Dellaglioa algida TaxID=105612 RepID=A0A5C6ME60_9LACO|nr:glycosyltransferase family 2 protein [Dellaglioa algida]MDK1719789.1 glycosyltransferase family 2 protein [Dellaglioa algida]MDK1723132.1 glycosyltransferase family 2 protein [Dellaglioa algida]MDK1739916.1 glycosyltransferase family 2 protein [Dellaglioa algida]TWW11171.1 hypothetical protein LABALGLTS371_06860 [Dellaglioa algida]
MKYKFDFSIIIPHYNNIEGLKILLNSIQENKFIGEVIVVDDKSSTSNKIQFELLKNAYPKVEFSSNNETKGPGTCRNIGIRKASGKWLLFADTDDIFEKNFFRIISEYGNSDYGVVYFEPILSSNIPKSDYRYKYGKLVNNYVNEQSDLNRLKIKTEFGIGCSKLVRSALVRENEITFGEMMMFEDSIFGLRVGLLSNKIGVSQEKIYEIIDTEGSLSKVKDLNYKNNFANLKINRYTIETQILSKRDQKILKISKYRLGYELFAGTKNINLTIKYLFKIFKKN